MPEITGTQLLDLIDDNMDWLQESEDAVSMLSALVEVSEKQLNAQPVAA